MSGVSPLDHLEKLTAPDGLRLLFAAERGSRCFGTDVPSSDHDIVAVVAHPPARYVSLAGVSSSEGTHNEGEVSSTILDLRRALQLASWGNVMLYQASRSAAVLHDVEGVGEFLRSMSARGVDPVDVATQHRDLMNRVKRTMDKREAEPAKAWVQLLQQVLSVLHVLRTREPAPVPYGELVAACTDADLARVAAMALARKRSGFTEGLPTWERDLVLRNVEAIRASTEMGKRARMPATPELVAEADRFLARILIGVG